MLSKRGRRVGKILIVILIVAAVFVVLVLLLGFGAMPLMNYLSRRADLNQAKHNGDRLLDSRSQTFLVIVAHPDDAEWYAGGTLASLVRAGNQVILIMGTSGEKGANVPDLGEIREAKQREAARIIGYQDVIFLRHPDRGLGESSGYEAEVKRLVDKYKPDVLFSFDVEKEGYVYRHPDHEAAGRASLAAAKAHPGLALYLFHSSAPDVLVEFEPVKEKKRQALEILSDYGPRSRGIGLSILRFVFRRRDGREPFEWYGMAERHPEVGVQYGEVFRRMQAK